jgi:hypothetical protein
VRSIRLESFLFEMSPECIHICMHSATVEEFHSKHLSIEPHGSFQMSDF